MSNYIYNEINTLIEFIEKDIIKDKIDIYINTVTVPMDKLEKILEQLKQINKEVEDITEDCHENCHYE